MEDFRAIKADAEAGQLDKIKTALSAIPPEEHLSIIRDLKQAEQGNPNLAVDIKPGSSNNNYDFTITYSGQNAPQGVKIPDEMVKMMAQAAGVSEAEERKMISQAQGGAGPHPLKLHETYHQGLQVLEADKKL